MSKYTTQVRFICESKAGIVEPYTNISYTEIIERARPKIFNFSYPIWNENKRKELETNILKHFYTNEIGSETFGLWQLRLDDWMNSHMPYYNPLFEALDKQYEMFLTDDFSITSDENTEHSKASSTNGFNSNASSNSSSNTTQDDKNNTKENRDGNEHRILDHVEKGYRGRSLVSIMNDYMKENTNIYNCLYKDMEVLFMRLW